MECWPRGIDVTADDAEQYEGWPKTIDQTDNYGRVAMGYLPEIKVENLNDPVVQVIYEPDNEVVYTLRIKGNRFKPKVFKDGKYTIKIGDQPNNMKVYHGLDVQEEDDHDAVLNVAF